MVSVFDLHVPDVFLEAGLRLKSASQNMPRLVAPLPLGNFASSILTLPHLSQQARCDGNIPQDL